MEGAKEVGGKKNNRKGILYEITFCERKGGRNKVDKHLRELPEPVALPKIESTESQMPH